MEKKIKSKIEIKLTERERDLLYFYLLGVYSLEDIETFEEYPAVVDKLEESITEVAKNTRRRRGVESKLEKLERVKPMSLMGMMGEVAPQWVAKELNKIIDHLNSQDQEEEKYKILKEARLYPERTLGKLIKETLEDTPEEITAEQLCEDNRKRMERLINKEMEERGFIRKIKDTPGEWREKFAEWGLWSLVEDISDDGDGEGDNLQLTKEGKEASRMIEQLLDERERELLEDIVNKNTYEQGVGYGDIASDVIKRLDKLNKKK